MVDIKAFDLFGAWSSPHVIQLPRRLLCVYVSNLTCWENLVGSFAESMLLILINIRE